MKFRISPLASDIIITIYAAVTLYYRFKLESQTYTSPILSLGIGICLIVIPWVLIKLKILNPSWFGLFNVKNSES